MTIGGQVDGKPLTLALVSSKLTGLLHILSELLGFPPFFLHVGEFLAVFDDPSHLLQQRRDVRPALTMGLFEPVKASAVVRFGWNVIVQVWLDELDLGGADSGGVCLECIAPEKDRQ